MVIVHSCKLQKAGAVLERAEVSITLGEENFGSRAIYLDDEPELGAVAGKIAQ